MTTGFDFSFGVRWSLVSLESLAPLASV